MSLPYCKFYRDVVPRDARDAVTTETPTITTRPSKEVDNEHEIKQMITLGMKVKI